MKGKSLTQAEIDRHTEMMNEVQPDGETRFKHMIRELAASKRMTLELTDVKTCWQMPDWS